MRFLSPSVRSQVVAECFSRVHNLITSREVIRFVALEQSSPFITNLPSLKHQFVKFSAILGAFHNANADARRQLRSNDEPLVWQSASLELSWSRFPLIEYRLLRQRRILVVRAVRCLLMEANNSTRWFGSSDRMWNLHPRLWCIRSKRAFP